MVDFARTRKYSGRAKTLVKENAGPVQFALDVVLVATSFVAAYVLRFEGIPPFDLQKQLVALTPYVVVTYVASNLIFGVYRLMWRYTGLKEAVKISHAVGTATVALYLSWIFVLSNHAMIRIPVGVLAAFPVMAYFTLLGARIARRVQFQRNTRRKRTAASSHHESFSGAENGTSDKKRVLLIGAGDAAQLLLRDLEGRPDFKIVGFADDDPRKQKQVINGVPVLGTTDQILDLVRKHNVHEVILAMPSAAPAHIRKIVAGFERNRIKVSSVPSLAEIAEGRVAISRLRQVKMEDLLGRAEVVPPVGDTRLSQAYYGKRMLVTGAAGSIGSELVRQLCFFHPQQLIMLDKDENALFELGLEMKDIPIGRFCEVVRNVREKDRLGHIFRDFRPQVVFHAAAYKHVPVMEDHPSEAILNNVVGTRNVAELASEYDAESFVMISTDKAVNPTSIMGASKRVAEILVRAQAARNGSTRFCCVRFGNVLGSRASVVPTFLKRIREGKNIQITHPDIERFFMTIPEAVQLVIQAGSLAQKGETFVLDMGDPVRIADLARELIEQSGLVLGLDIDIEYTGLRPGEKLFEELHADNERAMRSTDYPKIFVAEPVHRNWDDVYRAVSTLEMAARQDDGAGIYAALHEFDIGYQGGLIELRDKTSEYAAI